MPVHMKLLRDIPSVLNLTVLVAGLGYFVDLFDITLFGVVRIASLKDLGIIDPDELTRHGALIYNCQMLGMMVGGIVWGVLGDKRGRLSVMFGSILLWRRRILRETADFLVAQGVPVATDRPPRSLRETRTAHGAS